MAKHRMRIVDAPSALQTENDSARPGWSAVLRGLREARGVTQEGWATLLGYGRSTVQRWERGEAVPNADAVEALVKICREEGLLRAFARGRLQGITVTPELLRELLAEARQDAESRPTTDLSRGVPVISTNAAPAPHVPPRLTSFLGREPELAKLARLLETSRLLTLVGPPGVGKTRLALEGAREAGGRFPDGVYFISLAALDDPDHVLSTIAQQLGVAEGSGFPLREVLAAWLQPKALLLVLDNFEQIVGAAPEVLDLIRACPRIRVIATSRTRLHLSGEQLFPVAPLPIPVAPRATPGAILAGFASVRLFVERARAVQPEFDPTPEDLRTVGAICQHLDGLPLAIELAAARVRLFPPTALLPRLSSRLRLLTSQTQDQPARQRTLRATIDWSYTLLGEDEQAVLRRLSVFAGGCSLEAAAAICADEKVAEDTVAEVIARLVDKSLVVPEAGGDDVRIRLLETIREYAEERLVASPDADRTRKRHRDWFVAFAEQAGLALRGTEQFRWARRLDAEQDNLRTALTRSVERPEGTEAGLRLVGALAYWWQWQGSLVEGKAWLVRALAGRGAVDPSIRARALGDGSWLAFRHGDYDLARAFAQELLVLSQKRGDSRGILAALRTLAVTVGERAGDTSADAIEHESLAVCRELGECWESAHHLYILAVGRTRVQEYALARSYFEESLRILDRLGDRRMATLARAHLGAAARGEGDARRAEALLTEALGELRSWGDRTNASFCLAELAALARARGDLSAARARLDDSLRLSWEAGDRPGVARLLHKQAGLSVAESQPERAARLFGAAEALRAALGITWILPAERAAYEADVTAACCLLQKATFDRLWAQGRALDLQQAIGYALRSGYVSDE